MTATYRLQVEPGFPFSSARTCIPYLAALGVSHLYCAPVFEAVHGSRHGYDVTDPTSVRASLGGDAGRRHLVDTARTHRLGVIADLVPNHMAIEGNGWWDDVLRRGPASSYFSVFDIAEDPASDGRLTLPILARPYGDELLAGRLRVLADGGSFVVAYQRHRFPISADTEQRLLASGRPDGDADPHAQAAAIAEAISADTSRLHDLLESQHYRLVWWRLARDETPYRRFFDVNGLVGVRVEDPAIFDLTHGLVLAWVAEGSVDGLRVDHVDGLADPAAYLTRLAAAAPGLPVFVEKILAPDEHLPDWPVAGTTGYEFGAALTRLLIPAAAEDTVTAFYQRFTGDIESYEATARQARRDVLSHWLAGDAARVAGLLYTVCQEDIRLRDYSRRDCTLLVREFIARLPRYRTYVAQRVISPDDASVVTRTFAAVREARPDLPAELVEFAAQAMLGDSAASGTASFVARLQQLCTAVAAKAEEDTAFYRYVRFIAVNDVGARPDLFAETATQFHQRIAEWQRRHPGGLRATSTHDSKRGEDVRARLTVLAEAWDDWTARVWRWSSWAERGGDAFPDRRLEYYLYQTLVGAWPLSRERAHTHIEKAVREAKQFTSWETPVEDYEAAVRRLVDRVYDDPAWLDDITSFVVALHPADWHKGLAQTLLKLTVPGVPDVYQGAELWTLTLCDPDNRELVDFERRRTLLAELGQLSPTQILDRIDEGLPKLHVIHRTLELRQRHEDLRPDAAYQPMAVTGPRADSAIAFGRGTSIVVVAPIRTWQPAWRHTTISLPPGRWQHRFADACFEVTTLDLGDLFDAYPVALLERVAA